MDGKGCRPTRHIRQRRNGLGRIDGVFSHLTVGRPLTTQYMNEPAGGHMNLMGSAQLAAGRISITRNKRTQSAKNTAHIFAFRASRHVRPSVFEDEIDL